MKYSGVVAIAGKVRIDIQLVLINIVGSVDVTYSIMRINSSHIKYAQLQCPYELVVV